MRLIVDKGLVSKHNDNLELYRVRDIQIKKSLRQRTRGAGDIMISSTDDSTPQLVLESVPSVDEVAELIRSQFKEARAQASVIFREGL